MLDMSNAIRNTISISLFNRGLAGKIFDEVKSSGAKVVMKNNTAECVLLSPEDYVQLMEELNDARLLTLATERLENLDSSKLVPAKVVYADIGIDENNLADFEEVEFD